MGLPNAPWYEKDLGSAIETAEKVLAKIKTNKYDNKDLEELKVALSEIIVKVEKDED